MSETEQIRASDFARAWLGSLERVSQQWLPTSQWVSLHGFHLYPYLLGAAFLPQGTVFRGDPGCSANHGQPTL